MRASRRSRTAIAAVAVAALALTACSSDAESEGPDSSETPAGSESSPTTGEVVVASTAITSTLDPHAALSSVGRTYTRQVFDTLVAFDADGVLQPGLATEWERVDDVTMEFTLREGVTFQSGEPFTGQAVADNLARIKSGAPEFGLLAGRLGPIAEVEVVSDTVVRVITSAPDAVLLNRLTVFDILDPAAFDVAATEPSGTGPYRVVSHSPAEEIVLEAFEDSWRAPTSVTGATLVAIPSPTTMASALQTDEVDIAYGVPADVALQLEGQGFTVTNRPAGSAAINSLIADAEPMLEDQRVREAINLAINREEFVEAALGGFGIPNGSQFLQEGYFGHDPSIEPFTYDPDRAMTLIEEAGAEGLSLPIATTALFAAQAEAVAGYLNAVGFQSEVVIQELSAFIPTLLQQSEYPLLYWQTDYFDLRDIASVTRFGPTGEGQQAHIPVNDYQDLFVSQAGMLDPAEREATIQEMANILRDEAGVLFLAWPEILYTSASDVGALPLGGDSLVRLEEIELQS